MKKIAVLLIPVALLLSARTASADDKIYFKGRTVQEKRDGITIAGDKKQNLIAVTSTLFHYALVLPYSEDWQFSLEENSLLKGKAGMINLTLSGEKNAETPAEHLEVHKKDILANPSVKGIDNIQVITFKDEPVLLEVQDGEKASGDKSFRGVKVHHLFSAKRWKKDLYVLHLSQVVLPDEKFDQKLFLNLVTKGFNVEFARDEKK